MYVMVDYLIKTERALMGSYHESWAPLESDGEATYEQCSIVFDRLLALLPISTFPLIIFNPSISRLMMSMV